MFGSFFMRRCVEVNGKPVRECHYTCMHACIYRNTDRRITKKHCLRLHLLDEQRHKNSFRIWFSIQRYWKHTVHLMDGNNMHEILSVCPTRGQVYRPGHRLTRPRMYDLAVNSSDSVQQTAAGSCSTDTVPHTHHNFNARSFCKYKAVIMASITAARLSTLEIMRLVLQNILRQSYHNAKVTINL